MNETGTAMAHSERRLDRAIARALSYGNDERIAARRRCIERLSNILPVPFLASLYLMVAVVPLIGLLGFLEYLFPAITPLFVAFLKGHQSFVVALGYGFVMAWVVNVTSVAAVFLMGTPWRFDPLHALPHTAERFDRLATESVPARRLKDAIINAGLTPCRVHLDIMEKLVKNA